MATLPNLETPDRLAATDPVIRVEDLHKYYDLGETKVHALRGVSLDIKRGEFVAVMGASGRGKTTMMKILRCLGKTKNRGYLPQRGDGGRFFKKKLAGSPQSRPR